MTTPPPSAVVEVEGLRIRYGNTEVVKGVSLNVGAGEIVSLLGPSGCGKTTTLRAIAGFADPEAGTVKLHGRDVTDLAPNRRDIGMVFQGYALFPHLSVFDNVAYGLRMRKLPREKIAARVARALDLVKLGAFADRRPKQLSGRAAAARGNRPRAGDRAQGAAAGRAALEPRCQAAAGDARRAASPAEIHPCRLDLRHPRPGGGDHPLRPDRADE